MPTIATGLTWAGGAVVTPSKLNQEVNSATIQFPGNNLICGRVSSGAGTAEDLTPSQVRTMLGLAAVATSGAYSDLSGRPSLATVATSGAYSDLSGRPSLATVATSGAYGDLSGLPSLAQSIMVVVNVGAGYGGAPGPNQYTNIDISSFGFGGTPNGVANTNSSIFTTGYYDWDNSSSTSARVAINRYDGQDASGTYRVTIFLK